MLRKLLIAKIHRATVTRCDPDYVGSITIDSDLLEAAGMLPNEAVAVLDIDNAARFETYIIAGEPGSGEIGINGAAAHLSAPGHRVIILTYGQYAPDELEDHHATVVLADDENRVERVLHYESELNDPVY